MPSTSFNLQQFFNILQPEPRQFLPNQEASYLYFLAAGKMKYIRHGEDMLNEMLRGTQLWESYGIFDHFCIFMRVLGL